LLAELCREGLTALRSALEHESEGIQEPRARLMALGTAYVNYARERPDTYRLIFMEDAALTKGVFESIDSNDVVGALGLIIRAARRATRSGTLRKSSDPMRLADLPWAVVHGIASLSIACPCMPVTDDATLIATAFATIVDGSHPRTAH